MIVLLKKSGGTRGKEGGQSKDQGKRRKLEEEAQGPRQRASDKETPNRGKNHKVVKKEL